MKKLIALVLALALVLASCAVAFADPTYSITIDNAKKNITYNAYKVFDVTYAGTNDNPGTVPDAPAADNTHKFTSYAYSIVQDSDWWSTVTASGTTEDGVITANGLTFTPTTAKVGGKTVYNVAATNSFNAATFATVLDAAKANKSIANYATPTADGSVTIDVSTSGAGYYFVDTSLGSLCSLDTTEPSATIREKNSIPSQDKTQQIDTKPTSASGYTNNELQVQVGDTVYYQIEVTDGKGTDADIVITDTMSTGLTYNTAVDPVITLLRNGSETEVTNTEQNTYYTVTDKSAQGFKVTFVASYVSTLSETDKLYIRFSAIVNEAAAVKTETNKSKLEYQNQSSEDTVTVAPYKFKLIKNDGTNELLGAKFELYRGSVADGNKVYFTAGTAEGTGTDAVPVLNVAKGDTSGKFSVINLSTSGANALNYARVIFKGLDSDTYILREVEAPAGYNKAPDQTVASSALVKIDGTITASQTITVVNNTGTELPSTGGIGTTIFYILGGLLVVGAAVILVARRKASN